MVAAFVLHGQLRISCVTDSAILKRKKKRNSHKKQTGKNFCLGGKNLTISASHPDANIAAFPGDYSLSDVSN